MMNLDTLRQLYADDKRAKQMAAFIQKNAPAHGQWLGLVGSQEAFAVYGLQKLSNRPCLVLGLDKEDAAHIQNDLEILYEKETILFFPDSFRQSLRFDKLNRTNVLQRTEAVSRLVTTPQEHPCIVSYPEALFEKVVSPKELKEAAIQIQVKERLDVKFLSEVLLEYGFEEVDFVFEPGQFAVRGGIIDIYSYGNEYPYRVDLFDEEVESIRTFDPTSQLSTRKISAVTIVPNVNTQFKATQKTSLLEVLPQDCIIIIKNIKWLLDKLEACLDAIKTFPTDKLIEEMRTEEAELIKEQAFLQGMELLEQLEKRTVIEIYPESYFKNNILTIDYKGQPQPSFNKNFELLIRHLHQNTSNHFNNYICAENPKQLERFAHIFKDLQAKVQWTPIEKGFREGFLDDATNLACFTDHQIFERYHAYKIRQGFDKNNTLQFKALQDLKPGDFVTHIDHGIGRYAGLEKITLQGKQQEAVRLVYRDNDVLYVSIHSLHKISKYTGKENESPTIHKLGSGVWAATKQKTKKKIKELAFDLIQLYAQRKASKGFQYPEDSYLQNELEASFMYEDTPDQARATEDLRADMQKPYPMDRLICGDVGFGKTEVAIRGAFRAVCAGKQVAVLVPTTILALQHANTFRERLKDFGIKVEYINRFRTTKEKTEIYKQLEAGKIEIIIGTHALLNEKVKFKDLGLLIVDEEQKFGVGSKEKLRNLKVNVDTLTLTATPIPRTLQFSLMAARDLSIINTPPPNRKPIQTEVRQFDPEFIKNAIQKEIDRGGQVFFLHNRVQNLPEMMGVLKEMLPKADIAMAHGQMEATQLEETLLNFIKGYYEVLVCTNIIETGLDIPNANTIIINNAHQFGLSDLHQLRGRVGRSNKKAYCYLLAPPLTVLSSDAKKRLQTIEQFAELGSGFHIAMRDLDIRGAGDILGGEQSGFISNIGYETYQKILEEAVEELKQNEYHDLFYEQFEEKREFVHEVSLECDEEMLFPDSYISSIEERLLLYQRLDKIENEQEIEIFKTTLIDRFGAIPASVENLFEALRIRWVARRLGMERVFLQNKKLRCYFVSNPQATFFESNTFQQIIQYVQKRNDHRFYLKQVGQNLMLACEGVSMMQKAKQILVQMDAVVNNVLIK